MLDSAIMLLFLLLSVPLSFLVFYTQFFQDKVETLYILQSISRGILLALFGMILKWLMVFRLDFFYSFLSVFYYTLIHHGGLAVIAGVLLDLTIRLFRKDKTPRYRIRELSLQYASFLTVLGMFDVIYTGAVTGLLEPFILPVIRIGLLFILALGTERFLRVRGAARFLTALFLLSLILLSVMIEMLSYYQLPLIQILSAVIFLIMSLMLLFYEWKGKLAYGVKP